MVARSPMWINVQYFVGLHSFVNKVGGIYFLFGGCSSRNRSVMEDGRVVPGYLPPDRLIEELGI
ncbi:hypothetical protein ACJJIK_00025 [Microbulbifer sp. ZKSA006]|uniref:hypothetical protein n=1 Tax=Microbulbifer sp. ZKSA006 TaxID=3243390 RepID=UPI00403A1C18